MWQYCVGICVKDCLVTTLIELPTNLLVRLLTDVEAGSLPIGNVHDLKLNQTERRNIFVGMQIALLCTSYIPTESGASDCTSGQY